jgi:general secretion pathway protein H
MMRGFTLLEMLIVVAIIAIASAALIANAWPGGAARVDTEARRLAALLETAQAEARASGQPIAWAPEPHGYAFLRRGADGEWERFSEASIYRERRLDPDLEVRGERAVLMPYGVSGGVEAAIADRQSTIVLRSGALGRISLERIHAH